MSAAESPAQQPAQQSAQQSVQESGPQSAPVLVVMGVSGSGKSTVGAALAQRLRVPFEDADDFHPPANIAKMTAGRALDDDDRGPWLAAIGRWLAGHPDGAVMSCSALKRKYRDELRRQAPRAEFLHLQGSPEVIGRRQASRPGHFMPASLLASQFATLEPLQPDERGEVIDVDQSIDAIVQQYVDRHAARTDEPAPRSKEK
jgi:gluconokinase